MALVYLGLMLDGQEVTGPSYARLGVELNDQGYNDLPVSFPEARETWGAVNQIGLFEGPTSKEPFFLIPHRTLNLIGGETCHFCAAQVVVDPGALALRLRQGRARSKTRYDFILEDG